MKDKYLYNLVLKDGSRVEQFYYNKVYHLARYTPYNSPPSYTLCNKYYHFWSRSLADHPDRKICAGCVDALIGSMAQLAEALS